MSETIENSFEYTLAKEQTIVYIWRSIMQEYVYKTKDMKKFYDQVAEIVPVRCAFFTNWFKGFVSVAFFEFDEAKKIYQEAFKNITLAEEYTGRFVQQAFTFFMYVNDKKTALKVWEYGVSKKMVAPLDEAFFKSFNEKEQFWTQFAPTMFTNEKKAAEECIKDYTPKVQDKLKTSIEKADFKKFKNEVKNKDIDKLRVCGVSPLYFAIQTKATIKSGSEGYAQGMADFRTRQLLAGFNLEKASREQKEEAVLTVRHSMKQTYLESNLGRLMFNAYYCTDDEIQEKLNELNKIISFTIDNSANVDSFKINSGLSMTNTALYLAAETDDAEVSKMLILKGAQTDKANGKADFTCTKKDGRTNTTSIPNTFIYRLISFHSWNTLEMFLKDFSKIAKPQMTARTESSNITPLVYLIMTMIYSARNEKKFEENKKIVNNLLPLFINCGASLEQTTVFGSAKELLGL